MAGLCDVCGVSKPFVGETRCEFCQGVIVGLPGFARSEAGRTLLIAAIQAALPTDGSVHLLRVPAGSRVLTLEGQTPANVKKHGLDQLRVTFACTSRDAAGDLGRQLACIASWGLPKPAKQAKGGQINLLDGGDRG